MKMKRLNKTAMPARLGEIDGIVNPMPANLSEESKLGYPSYDSKKVKKLIATCDFLRFMFSSLGSDENALREVYSSFVLENSGYCKRYKEG